MECDRKITGLEDTDFAYVMPTATEDSFRRGKINHPARIMQDKAAVQHKKNKKISLAEVNKPF